MTPNPSSLAILRRLNNTFLELIFLVIQCRLLLKKLEHHHGI